MNLSTPLLPPKWTLDTVYDSISLRFTRNGFGFPSTFVDLLRFYSTLVFSIQVHIIVGFVSFFCVSKKQEGENEAMLNCNEKHLG